MNKNIFSEMKPKYRNFILLSIVMCPFITQIDVGMMNLALPSISAEFGITSSAVTWISSIYIVVISATVLLFGKMGDTFGHIKILKIGMFVFTLATFIGGFSYDLKTMLVSRIFQALGASLSLGNTHGTITRVIPMKERGKAFGINAASVALGTLIGPSIGGIILSYFSWNLLFFIKIPICILILIMQFCFLQDRDDGTAENVDWIGSLYFFITVACFFISLQQLQKLGISNPFIIGGFSISAIFLYAFIEWQKKSTNPLLDLDLFNSRTLVYSLICTLISYSAISATNLIMPFYLQSVRGMTASESGMLLAVYPLVLVFIAPISGWLSDKIGSEILTLYGLAVLLAGLIGMIFISEKTAYWMIIAVISILGIGSGLFQSPNFVLVMDSVPSNRLGVGGSLNALSRNVGNNLGIALTTIILYNGISRIVGYHTTSYIEERPDAFIFGMRNTYICIFMICIIAFILAYQRYKSTTRKT